MFNGRIRQFALAGAAATMLLAPAESQAIANWFGCGGLFGRPGCTSYRVSYFGGCNTCCTPCCPTQVCNYVPQVAYRACSVAVPVTSYRPVTTCDPCTGCPVTCMRPVTTYVRQTRYTPYTTYRLSCSTTCATPVAAYYVPGAVAADCCSTGQATPAPSLQVAPPTTPEEQGSGNQDIPSTLREQEASFRLRPVPDHNINIAPPADDNGAQPAGPQLTEPGSRTAAMPVLRPWSFEPVQWQSAGKSQANDATAVAQPSTARTTSDDGWRASTR